MGIEPTCPAWKAGVLPLNYTRKRSINIKLKSGWQDSNLRLPGPKPGALAKLSHTPSPRRYFALAQRLIIILKTFCFVNRVFQFLIICLKAVQTGCISTLNRRRDHLHRKTSVLPYELARCCASFDLSVGPTMFFSQRLMPCAGHVLQIQPVCTAATSESTR